MSELPRRLRGLWYRDSDSESVHTVGHEAAAEIERLHAELKIACDKVIEWQSACTGRHGSQMPCLGIKHATVSYDITMKVTSELAQARLRLENSRQLKERAERIYARDYDAHEIALAVSKESS